jgi:hypothetical protein
MMVEVAFGETSCEIEEAAAESSDQDMEDGLFFELLLTSV